MENMPAPEENELNKAHALQQVCAALVQTSHPEDLYKQIVNAAFTLMHSQAASMQILDSNTGDLRLLAWKGFHPTSAEFWNKVQFDSASSCGAALASGQRFIVPDVEHCDRMAGSRDLEEYRQSQIRAVQSTPLVSRSGEMLGMVSTHWSLPHTPSEADLRYLDVLVRLTSDLIEQKRADQQLRESEAWLSGQKQAFQAAMTGASLSVSLETLTRTAVHHFNGEVRAAFYLANQETATLHHIAGMSDAYAQSVDNFKISADSLACGLAMRQGETVITSDVTCDPRWESWRRLAHEHGYRGCWSFPVRTTDGPVLGTFALYFSEPREPTSRELELVGVLTHAATIIMSRHEEAAERARAEAALLEAQDRLQRWNDELEDAVLAKTVELTRSQDDLRALATELNLAEQRERQRLATELHDHLAQTLVLSKLKLAQGKRVVSPPACVEMLQEVDDILSDALQYTRTLVTELSPPALQEHGLVAGLKWLAKYMTRHRMDVAVDAGEQAIVLPGNQAVLLFQSVRELLINASKYAGTGQANVTLEQRNGQIRIVVQDNGVGFDFAAAPAADPSDGGVSSKFGLFSIRERMKALGGSFNLQSAPGQGTTATLILPLPEQDPSPVQSVAFQQSAKPLSAPRKPPASEVTRIAARHFIRVLLVDDHLMVRQGLKTILQNYTDLEIVGEASNGEEALAFSEQLRPDVVVMDVNMPGMSGIEATAHLKVRYPELKVIGISVNIEEETRAAMKKAGAVRLITKEAAVDTLYETILMAMRGITGGESSVQYDLFAPIVLIIDGNEEERRYWVDRLKISAPDYVVLEAANGETGLHLCRTRRVHCVVLELELPDMSGSKVLVNLVPRIRQREVAVVMLTRKVISDQMADFLRQNGAQACLVKSFSSGEELRRVIEKSMGVVGLTGKESRP